MPPPKQYNVVDSSGAHVGVVDAADVGKLPAGQRIANEGESKAIVESADYGGIGGMATSAALGLAHGATLGGSTALLGRTSFREDINKLRRYNPMAFAGGDIAGAIGGTFIGGPAAWAAKAGMKAATRVGARGVGMAGQLAAGAAVEGAITGVGEGIAQASLDNKLSGQKMAATILAGGVAGGVFGGGLGAIGQGFGAGRRAIGSALNKPGAAAAQRVGDAAFDGAAGGFGRKFTDKMSDISAVVSGNDAGTIRKFAAFGEDGKRARKLATEGDKLKPQYVESMAQAIDRAEGAWNVVSDNIRDLGQKAKGLAKRMADVDGAGSQSASLAMFDDLGATVATMRAGKDQFKQGGLKALESAVETLKQKAIRGAQKIEHNADRAAHWMMAADELKREVGKYSKAAQRPAFYNKSLQHTAHADELTGAYERLRKGLESAEHFGDAGRSQQQINAALSDYFGHSSRFRPSFMAKHGIDPVNPWRSNYIADRGKLERFVGRMGLTGNDIPEKVMRDTLIKRREAARQILDHLSLDAKDAAAVKRVVSEADAVLKHMDEAGEVVGLGNQLADLDSAGSGLGGAMVGGAIGAGFGEVALLAAPFLSPGRTIRQLAAVERLAGDFDSQLAKGVAGMFGKVEARPAALAAARVAEKASTNVKAWKDSREEYAVRSERVRQMADSADAMRAQAAQAMEHVADGAPKAHAEALATAARGLDYLEKHMPAIAISQHPFGNAPSVSVIDAEAWLRRARAIENPVTLLNEMAAGKLSREGVDAIRAVYPDLFGDLQSRVLAKVTDLDADGKRVPYEQRKQLGILLDIPTDGTLQPSVIAAVQGMYANAAKQKPQQRQPPPQAGPDIAGAYATGTQQMEAI